MLSYVRRCRFEQLEDRRLLSINLTALNDTSISGNTGEKPQSKVWMHDDTWFSALARSGGTWVSRLDGPDWTPILRLSTSSFLTDVKATGDVTHILLEKDDGSKLASVQYVPGSPGTYEFWSPRPSLADIALSSDAETATIDVDSTGRMWVASDARTDVEVRFSDFPYATWSNPITVASSIGSDDISVITALPDDSIGVLWSDQRSDRFGFRVHDDGAAPGNWSADEVPASQSAQNVGGGMADDHLNVAVASDGTLYAAVKTSFDSGGFTKIGLLVRRPSGNWDPMYEVDTRGTRGVVILNEAQDQLLVAYRDRDSSGPIVYRETALSSINFGAKQTLIPGSSMNNVSSTKQNFTSEVVAIAAGSGTLRGVLLSTGPVQNQVPSVNAGPDQTIFDGQVASLDGTVSDDGLPLPPNVTTSWTVQSAPAGGTVTFGNASMIDTTAEFNLIGNYVLRLTANDGELAAFDQLLITVEETPPFTSLSFQDGVNGYTGTQDTRIRSDMPDRNFGSSKKVEVDGNPDFSSLIRWDLGSIATGATVTSATITINVVKSSNDVFELYELKRPWTESEATFNQASAGAAWEIAGASGAGDRGSIVLGTVTAPQTGLTTIELDAAGVAAVQSWVANPATNYGLIFQDYTNATTDDLDFNSSETSKVANRPMLSVVYSTGDPQPPTNQPPLVDAGMDQTIFESAVAALDGTVTDDGLPLPAGVTTTWTAQSTPVGATVTFGDASMIDTTAQFDALGDYALRLTANDGELGALDEVTITVVAPPANQPPVVDAGLDQTIFESAVATLDGTVSDDGLPLPANVTTTWTVESAPVGGTVTFDDASAIDTTAQFDALGDYVLRLTANDGELETFDEVTISVEEAPAFVVQSFQDGLNGYTGTRDTRIRSDLADRVFGSSSKLEIDGNPDFSSLIQWDLSSIPTGAKVLSATIRINVLKTSQDFFELYELKRSWAESEATFNQAAAGVAWETAGAAGAGDHGSTVLGAITAPVTGLATSELNAAGLAVVQSWIGDPGANFGLIFQDYTNATTDDLDFNSSETSTVADRPMLTVVYSLT